MKSYNVMNLETKANGTIQAFSFEQAIHMLFGVEVKRPYYSSRGLRMYKSPLGCIAATFA